MAKLAMSMRSTMSREKQIEAEWVMSEYDDADFSACGTALYDFKVPFQDPDNTQ